MFGRNHEQPPPIPAKPLNPESLKSVSMMTFDELIDMKQMVDRELEHRGMTELSGLKERLLTIAAIQGVSIGEIFAPPKPERKKKDIPPKYICPDSGQTWTGRGKQPGWIKEKIEAGHPLEEFLIQ